MEMVTVTCAECGKSFERSRSYYEYRERVSGRHFCTRACSNRANIDGERQRAARLRVLARSDKEPTNYPKAHGRRIHRAVAEEMLGRPLEPGEVVHHINGDQFDNRPENLQVLPSQAEHARIHAEMRRQAEAA